MERGPWRGPGAGDSDRGWLGYGLGDPRPLAGEAGRDCGELNMAGGGPLGTGPGPFAGRGFTGRAERQVRGATPC